MLFSNLRLFQVVCLLLLHANRAIVLIEWMAIVIGNLIGVLVSVRAVLLYSEHIFLTLSVDFLVFVCCAIPLLHLLFEQLS